MAFETATKAAYRQSIPKAKPQLLEPMRADLQCRSVRPFEEGAGVEVRMHVVKQHARLMDKAGKASHGEHHAWPASPRGLCSVPESLRIRQAECYAAEEQRGNYKGRCHEEVQTRQPDRALR